MAPVPPFVGELNVGELRKMHIKISIEMQIFVATFRVSHLCAAIYMHSLNSVLFFDVSFNTN